MSRIFQLAKELDISTENLLAGIAREELCALFYLTEFGQELYLMPPEDLGCDSYKKKANRSLRFAYCPKKHEAATVEEAVSGIVGAISGVNGEDGIAAKLVGDKKISLEVRLEKMRVPMKIELFDMSNMDIKPEEKRIKLIRNGEECPYLAYPTEADVATDITGIVKSLELIEDMSVYDKLFFNITNSPMEGKKVWRHLKEGFSASGIDLNENPLEVIYSYANDPYMKKKWDKYIKRQNIKSHDWKTIVTAIHIFIFPIYEAIVLDKPFVGDWMPELGRFL